MLNASPAARTAIIEIYPVFIVKKTDLKSTEFDFATAYRCSSLTLSLLRVMDDLESDSECAEDGIFCVCPTFHTTNTV